MPALQERFPGSSQVALLVLERATDASLCDYAALHGFVICSKDDDFRRLAAARAYRPRLVHLNIGNASNDAVLAALLAAAAGIRQAFDDPGVGLITIE